MPVDPASLAIQASMSGLKSLVGLFTGRKQKREAKRLLAGLQYPTESMPEEVLQNQQLAGLRAKTGLPSEQYNQAMQNIQRQQMMTMRGAGDRRSGLGLLGSTQQFANDALLGLDVANAKARIANEKTFMGVNNQVAGWKSKLFDSNVRQKYNRDYNYAMSLLGQGNKNMLGAFDSFGAGLGMAGAQGLGGVGLDGASGSGNAVNYGFAQNKNYGTAYPY